MPWTTYGLNYSSRRKSERETKGGQWHTGTRFSGALSLTLTVPVLPGAFRSLGEEIQRLLASLQKQREGGAEGEREKSRRDDSRRRWDKERFRDCSSTKRRRTEPTAAVSVRTNTPYALFYVYLSVCTVFLISTYLCRFCSHDWFMWTNQPWSVLTGSAQLIFTTSDQYCRAMLCVSSPFVYMCVLLLISNKQWFIKAWAVWSDQSEY